MPTHVFSQVDGIVYDQEATAAARNPGLQTGRRLLAMADTNVSGGAGAAPWSQVNFTARAVSGLWLGAIVIPAASFNSAGAMGTVQATGTIAAPSTSFVLPVAVNAQGNNAQFGGDTTAGRGVHVWVEAIASGTITFGVRVDQPLAQNWTLWFAIFN